MLAAADALLAQLQAQRLRWVALPDSAVRLQVDTPSAFRAARVVAGLKAGDGDAVIAELVPLVRAWEGITGAMVLGPAVGSADSVPLHAGLLAVLLGDRPGWVSHLAHEVIAAAAQVREQLAAASGN